MSKDRIMTDNKLPLNKDIEVSILILALNEAGNIGEILADIKDVIAPLQISYELVVVDGGSIDSTRTEAKKSGAFVVDQKVKGYAKGLIQGFGTCRGKYILTLDGDCSHSASLINNLLKIKDNADIIVCSRWIEGGTFHGSVLRRYLSKILNKFFKVFLCLPVADSSSGYRLYNSKKLCLNEYLSDNFSILQEIIINSFCKGNKIIEIPLNFTERKNGKSKVELFKFALSYLSTFRRMYAIRFDSSSCDYDSRAYKSKNLIQRYWQQKRFYNIRKLIREFKECGVVLDVGCGSSSIIQSLPHAIAMDFSLSKLKYLSSTNKLRVNASAFQLPFKSNSIDCLINSQLIEHLPMDDVIFEEMKRVLKPNGVLILGTVDYGKIWWPIIEYIYGKIMPNAYADEHISHYTFESLKQKIEKLGFKYIEVATILKSEITLKFVKH